MKQATLRLLGAALVGWPLLSAACMEADLMNQSFDVKGVASNMEGQPLYIEILQHRPTQTGGTLAVDYYSPDEQRFATKQVDYNCRPGAPAFTLLDLSTGDIEGVAWDNDNVRSFSGGETATLELPVGDVVVDAGFDNTIKLNWERLMAGDPVVFDYLFVRNNRFIALKARRVETPENLSAEADASTVFFRIDANNLFFRMLSRPMYVGYDQASRELRYFQGPSNLPMMDDQDQVIIRYSPLPSSAEQPDSMVRL